ncbi:MAG: PAS domain-containing sensor histidine kinase [Limnohabitans sp.]|nr:PAS domain-containing sensor histidine kinase [Limnohabitans sp.]
MLVQFNYPQISAIPKKLNQKWLNWWRVQSPSHQDRLALLAPLGAVTLFFVAIVVTIAYLRVEEIEREQESAQRELEYAQQQLRLKLLERQEQLMRIAREISNKEIGPEEFIKESQGLVTQYPEINAITWIDQNQRIKSSFSAPSVQLNQMHSVGKKLKQLETINTFNLAKDLKISVYSEPVYSNTKGQSIESILELHLPISMHSKFEGVVMADFSIDGLLRYTIPTDIRSHHAVAFLDGKGNILAGQSISSINRKNSLLPWSNKTFEFTIPVSPVGNSLNLRAQIYRTSQGLIANGMFWLVMALSGITIWLLIGTWRHTRRRLQAQQALIAETNFRRAMENSILTGMRAMDLNGKITYVNTAFCQMTGWTEAELVGLMPPFPYWPDEDKEILTSKLADELQGRTTSTGFQVRVKRKNATVFDARLYVSPLVDARSKHTGWMTSMTDITEPNRIREQLTASYKRFTKVLEALDASVSVAPLGSSELLFTNKLYRLWFGNLSEGHLQMVKQAGTSKTKSSNANDSVDDLAGFPVAGITETLTENAEIFIPELNKWLEVRSRYLNWVDGRLAQMVIATDITPRRLAEEQSALQAERAQSASRLITMGEMASSVAHELNQPLTAISNYCNGMVSRIQGKQISDEELLKTLEKTAHQAQRAGQIIQRIKSFVKRSEANRMASNITEMVTEALELANIELRRHMIKLNYTFAHDLPQVMVDPILIEQVLINLLKNAAESIDLANRPHHQRLVQLHVMPAEIKGQSAVLFKVTDSGKGLAPEVLNRLFEAFFSTKTEGMGIGLNLCRSIVESHQGRMQAENLYNRTEIIGCQFSFWLPAWTEHLSS